MKFYAAVALLTSIAAFSFPCRSAPTTSTVISSINLTRPFETRSHWRFTAYQDPDTTDPVYGPGDPVPGKITLCISNDDGRVCRPDLTHLMHFARGNDWFSEPHYLNQVQIVKPPAHKALLVLQIASLHGGDNDQRVVTQIFHYNVGRDGFEPVYEFSTGRNNNQDVRYINGGPLDGAVISAEPAKKAPFGFWITVNKLTPAYTYRPVLRYRSATIYGDNNPLSVIDSEMPNIQRHLGLWHTGLPLPLPKGRCPKPHLIRTELWCK
jgi:hypothetical protein